MESLPLAKPNNKNTIKALMVVASILAVIGIYNLGMAICGMYASIEILQTHDDNMEWGSLSDANLPNIEKKLEDILKEVNDGLPLTTEQMQKLQSLYKQLLAKGDGFGGIVAYLISLCEKILIASQAMELYLENLQNGQQDGDNDIQGVERK